MKNVLTLLLVVMFSLSYVPKTDAQDAGTWVKAIDAITVVIDGVSDGCDELRESGNLQLRCKNQKCVTVACISLRKQCGRPGDDPDRCEK